MERRGGKAKFTNNFQIVGTRNWRQLMFTGYMPLAMVKVVQDVGKESTSLKVWANRQCWMRRLG